MREPSRGVFADGATARDPRDAATGSDRERRRGAVARVCAYRERGGRSGAVQRANNRGFERRERRRRFIFSVSARDGRRFFVARPSRALFQEKDPVEKPLPTRSFRSRLAWDGRPADGRRPLNGSSARGLEPGPRRRVTRVRDVAACARSRRTVTRGGKARLPFRASVQLGKTDISTMTGAGHDRGRLLRDGKESAGRAGRQPGCRRERTAGAALPARALWLPRECRSDELVAIVKICPASHFFSAPTSLRCREARSGEK